MECDGVEWIELVQDKNQGGFFKDKEILGNSLTGQGIVDISGRTPWSELFNPLKPSNNNMYHLLQQSVTLHYVFMGFV
jgi:hypothetical protein